MPPVAPIGKISATNPETFGERFWTDDRLALGTNPAKFDIGMNG
jgi:hypothetical protein